MKNTITSSFENIWREKTETHQKLWFLGKIIPNSPADQCGQLHVNDRILAVNGIDLSHMLHTDVVNLIKESGRAITLAIGPPIHYGNNYSLEFLFDWLFFIVENDRSMENENSSNGIRPSSSSVVMSNGNNHQALRNAYSHNPLNTLEKYVQFF